MPGDTKIKQCPSGWFDVDHPTVFHPTRWQARDARRGVIRPIIQTAPKTYVATVTQTVTRPTTVPSMLHGLQQRLYDRLTTQQGVTPADAYDVITSNGYNAAASYGHMREAGANHSEATFVISIGAPDLSVAYGLARASGYNHTGALQKALREVQDAQDASRDD